MRMGDIYIQHIYIYVYTYMYIHICMYICVYNEYTYVLQQTIIIHGRSLLYLKHHLDILFRHRGSVSSDIDLGWGMKRAKPLEKSGKVNSGRVKHGTSNKTRWKIGRIRTCKELIKNMCVALPSADLGPPKIPDMSACTHGNPSWLEPENGGPIWKTRGRLWQPFSGQPSGCFIVACYAMTYYILWHIISDLPKSTKYLVRYLGILQGIVL